jgi:Mn-dependent DtxR family transcriptional regulator
MLREIRRLLEEYGRLSLRELSLHFSMSPDALEPMLDMLVSKGLIKVVSAGCAKGSCANCSCADRADTMLYELVA